MEESSRQRLDKWLWAARFFKTRGLAQEAIEGGKVHVEGARVKSSRLIGVGQTLEIVAPHGVYTVVVQKLSERRGPAVEAAQLYVETPDSIVQREAHRSAQSDSGSWNEGRPDKRQRRLARDILGRS